MVSIINKQIILQMVDLQVSVIKTILTENADADHTLVKWAQTCSVPTNLAIS